MSRRKIDTCSEMVGYVNEIGFLPLLSIGVGGWSADDVVDSDCRYVALPDGGWEWALWRWKGEIIRESGCAYGKFFRKKVAFISKEWWPDFCNYRRSVYSKPEENTIEDVILQTLRDGGSMIARDLRRACGFSGPKMRGKFDACIAKLQMGCYVVTKDFVYPHDRHGKEYGWGWSLLTTPEDLFGPDVCNTDRSAEESYRLVSSHLKTILPSVDDKVIKSLLK